MKARQDHMVRGKKPFKTQGKTLRIFCMPVFSWLINKGLGTGTLPTTK